MSGYTKYNLETAIKNGYRIAEDFAASRLMFEQMHSQNSVTWETFIDLKNGNYQEVKLYEGNQWIRLTNPGAAGIYYLILRKSSVDLWRARIVDGADEENSIEWIGEPLSDDHLISMGLDAAILITIFWDGTKYIAHKLPTQMYGRTPKHGYLYNWHAVNSGQLEIPGYRIPSREDFNALKYILVSSQGQKLKAASPLWDGTDQYGFRALATGRREFNGDYLHRDVSTAYWTSEQYAENTNNAYCWYLASSSTSFLEYYTFNKNTGFPIRLIRNGVEGYTPGEKVRDVENNVYDTVRITVVLNQYSQYDEVWLKQNLATTRFNEGTRIPYVSTYVNNNQWQITSLPALCSYNNNLNNVMET